MNRKAAEQWVKSYFDYAAATLGLADAAARVWAVNAACARHAFRCLRMYVTRYAATLEQ